MTDFKNIANSAESQAISQQIQKTNPERLGAENSGLR
jgi:hypothetical protein